MELSTLSTEQLRALNDQVAQMVQARKKTDSLQAREEIIAIGKRVGVPLDELLGGLLGKDPKVKKSGSIVLPQYRNPKNASETWSGRGRNPQWVKDYLATPGKSLQDLKISDVGTETSA